MDKSFRVVGRLSPQSLNSTTGTSGWIQADAGYRIGAIIVVGTIGATVDWKLEQANTSVGGAAKDLYVGAQFAASDDDTSKSVDLDVSVMDTENGFYWYRLSATAGAVASLVAGVVLALDLRYAP